MKAYRFIAATILVAIGGFAAQLALTQPGIGRTEVHVSNQAAAELATYLVDKGKPIVVTK